MSYIHEVMSYEICVMVGTSQNGMPTPKCLYEFKSLFFLAHFVSFHKYSKVKYFILFFIDMAHCIPLMTFFMHVRIEDHVKCTSCFIFDKTFWRRPFLALRLLSSFTWTLWLSSMMNRPLLCALHYIFQCDSTISNSK